MAISIKHIFNFWSFCFKVQKLDIFDFQIKVSSNFWSFCFSKSFLLLFWCGKLSQIQVDACYFFLFISDLKIFTCNFCDMFHTQGQTIIKMDGLKINQPPFFSDLFCAYHNLKSHFSLRVSGKLMESPHYPPVSSKSLVFMMLIILGGIFLPQLWNFFQAKLFWGNLIVIILCTR